MNKLLSFTLCSLTLALTNAAYAHGEEQPGPHNGFIKMPGAYHVELIPHKNSIDIMLLDIDFKDPIVLNSNVNVKIKSGKVVTTLQCTAKNDHFNCPASKKLLNSKGILTVKSKRDRSEGMSVNYSLPLQTKKQ
jgi:hypothetical protein